MLTGGSRGSSHPSRQPAELGSFQLHVVPSSSLGRAVARGWRGRSLWRGGYSLVTEGQMSSANQPLFYLDCVWQCISEIAVVTERLLVPFPPSSPQCLAGPPFRLVHLGQPHVVGMASLFSFVLFSFLQCWRSNPRPCAH